MTQAAKELGEFDVIAEYFSRQHCHRNDVVTGIGDDGAIVRVPEGQDLVLTVDTLISGVHFPVDTPPVAIGYKALAVNLSDLAAMGATPAWATLALSLSEIQPVWLQAFCDGFFTLANEFNVQLLGGDTTRGPLTMSVQLQGLVPSGQALRRSGARVGDRIFVTGMLGLAAFALQHWQGFLPIDVPTEALALCVERLQRPRPRVEWGLRLRSIASSAIDVSDGLAADLGHILRQSGVGAEIELGSLPTVQEIVPRLGSEQAWSLALTGGDDYELCFTAPASFEQELADLAAECAVSCTRIGTITSATAELRCVRPDGSLLALDRRGYRHF